ncbi:MAG: hypothetical protein AB8C02_05420 [Halioglobus sp.]
MADQVKSSQEQKNARQDLYAQQEMARWTFYMSLASLIGMGVAILGIYYLRGTLDRTADASEAALAANKIMRDEARAWLDVSVDVQDTLYEHTTWRSLQVSVSVKNKGKTMAKGVFVRPVILPRPECHSTEIWKWSEEFSSNMMNAHDAGDFDWMCTHLAPSDCSLFGPNSMGLSPVDHTLNSPEANVREFWLAVFVGYECSSISGYGHRLHVTQIHIKNNGAGITAGAPVSERKGPVEIQTQRLRIAENQS